MSNEKRSMNYVSDQTKSSMQPAIQITTHLVTQGLGLIALELAISSRKLSLAKYAQGK